jgi:hypothetical protein
LFFMVRGATEQLGDKLTRLKAQMQKLKALQAAIEASPDKQVSFSDPDTRLMVIGDRLTGTVGYNVQTVTETEHHLIIAHEVTNHVGDRGQLPHMIGARPGEMLTRYCLTKENDLTLIVYLRPHFSKTVGREPTVDAPRARAHKRRCRGSGDRDPSAPRRRTVS